MTVESKAWKIVSDNDFQLSFLCPYKLPIKYKDKVFAM
jgi:hypothetical protein